MQNLKLFCISLIILVLTLFSGVNAQTITYSEPFTSGGLYCPGTPQYDNWVTFRSQLDTNVYDFIGVTIKGDSDLVGRTCTDRLLLNKSLLLLKVAVLAPHLLVAEQSGG